MNPVKVTYIAAALSLFAINSAAAYPTSTTSPLSSKLTQPPPTLLVEQLPVQASQNPKARNIRFSDQFENVVLVAPFHNRAAVEADPFYASYGDEDVADLPVDDIVNGDDLATAQSNIVFRPLFTYRRQTAQKRKIYEQSLSSMSKKGQRRRQMNPYYSYPNYYANAQYDLVF